MIVYKIDKHSYSKVGNRIREMDAVLREIPTTLQILSDLVDQHDKAMDTPSVNNFRKDLQYRLQESVTATTKIADDIQRLVTASDQIAKYLAALEEHFGTPLRSGSTDKTSEQQLVS